MDTIPVKIIEKVFFVVKRQCSQQKKFVELHRLDKIAAESGIPLSEMDLYLEYLEWIGLIRYSMTEQYVYLTAEGKLCNEDHILENKLNEKSRNVIPGKTNYREIPAAKKGRPQGQGSKPGRGAHPGWEERRPPRPVGE